MISIAEDKARRTGEHALQQLGSMLGFKDRYQLNEWKLMGTGHAAEMKESDRKGRDTPWPHFGQGVSVTRGGSRTGSSDQTESVDCWLRCS